MAPILTVQLVEFLMVCKANLREREHGIQIAAMIFDLGSTDVLMGVFTELGNTGGGRCLETKFKCYVLHDFEIASEKFSR